MKTDIHPKYFDKVEIRCSCGNIILTGSTKEGLKTELCSKCHPFYTGQQKLVDTAGRVDKFEAKRTKAAKLLEEKKTRTEAKKKKTEVYVEKEIPQEVIERAMTTSPKTEGKWGRPLGDSPAEEVVKEEIAAAAAAKKSEKKKSKPAQKSARSGWQAKAAPKAKKAPTAAKSSAKKGSAKKPAPKKK